jgi:hypothetical protein
LVCGGPLVNPRRTCDHPQRKFYDGQGYEYWASHEAVVGRTTADGNRATKHLAAYPKALNKSLAVCIAKSKRDEAPSKDKFQ